MAGFAPLRTQTKNPLNEFLDFYLPELLKNKMQIDQVKKQAEIWLRNQLAEYEAYGEIQSKQGKESFKREALLKFLSPSFYEKRPMPEVDLAKTIRDFLPPEVSSELGITIPPGAEQNLAASIAAMTGLGSARQTLESFPAEQMAPLIRTFGEKPLLDVLDQIRTEKQKAAELGIRAGELTEAGKSRVLRGEELGVRGAELEAEKPAGKKALAAKLEKKLKDRQDYIDDYWGTGKSWQERVALQKAKSPEDIKARRVLTNQISDISDEIKTLKEKLGIPPDPKYKAAADALKAQGIEPEDLLSNKLFDNKRTGERKGIRDIMIDHGYDIFKTLEAWK